MAAFVLVPGAMHGAWCWQQVKELLEAAGHDVHTPLMPGVGELVSDLTPAIGAEDHVRSVLADCEGADEITLVCHSYSGVLAGPVVERSGRIANTVLIGAFIVHPGESLMDVEPAESVATLHRIADTIGDGWKVPFTDPFLERWGVDDPRIADLLREKLTPFPLKCGTDVIEFDPRPLAATRRVWVDHIRPADDPLALSRSRAEDEGWEVRMIDSTHDTMLMAPAETAALLEAIAAGR